MGPPALEIQQNCVTWKFQCQIKKTKAHGNSTGSLSWSLLEIPLLFRLTPAISTCFLQVPWNCNELFQKKMLGVEDMEFPTVYIEEITRISRLDQKKIWNFQGPWFYALKFPKCVTQFCRVCRGEAFFCLEFPEVK